MHKRMWVMLVLALVLALVSAPLGGCTATSDGDEPTADAGDEPKEPYVVGAVLSLTGAQSGLGGPEKNAIDMEVARINEEGGINGHPLEVIIEDDASDVDQAIARTTKLIEQDGVVAIIGSTGTGQSMAMRDVIDAAGIPQVSLAGSLVITKDFDPLVFQTPWSNALVVDTTLEYLKAEGHTKIGLITEDTGFGKDGQALVNETAADYGLEVVSDQVFKPADTDMTGQLTVIKGAGADVVLMWSSVAASSIVPKNMAQLGMDIPLVGSHGIARQEFVDSAADAAEGVVMFAGKILAPEAYGVGSESYEAATAFIDRYTETYGEAPTNTFAGHAYDGLYLVVEALKRLDEGFTSADLRDEIEKTSGFAGIGGVFTFSATDHNGMTADDLVGYVASGGAWTLLQ
ncbi:MAG: ABC transporter substrate-binding protein [Coriobacteriia bacterium]|nr:ABC transporter substrate-binding protein [Coriobacteriia bacterium]